MMVPGFSGACVSAVSAGTTSTGQRAWVATYVLTDPASRPVSPEDSDRPTTTSSADPLNRLRYAPAGSPSTHVRIRRTSDRSWARATASVTAAGPVSGGDASDA